VRIVGITLSWSEEYTPSPHVIFPCRFFFFKNLLFFLVGPVLVSQELYFDVPPAPFAFLSPFTLFPGLGPCDRTSSLSPL